MFKGPGPGRPKGSKDKRTLNVEETLAKLGLNPIEQMARFVLDESLDMTHRVKLVAELANYIAPKRKAVEMSGDLNATLTLADVLRGVKGEDEPAS